MGIKEKEWASILSSLVKYKKMGYLTNDEYEYYKEVKKQELDKKYKDFSDEELTLYVKCETTLEDDEVYDLFDSDIYGDEALKEKISTLNNADLYNVLDSYNWDDGFVLPAMLLNNKECDWNFAIRVFEYADGESVLIQKYLEKKECSVYEQEWWNFCLQLFEDLGAGKYSSVDYPEELSIGLKIALAKNGIVNELNKEVLNILKK